MKLHPSHWVGLATGLLLSGVAITAGCPEFFTQKHLEALTGDSVSTRAFRRSAGRPVVSGGLLSGGVPQPPPGP